MKTKTTTAGKARKSQAQQHEFTTAEIKAGKRGDPEWVDFPGLFQIFSIKRALGYQLAAEGKVVSVACRHRGRTRGKRLFSVDSIRRYLRECQSNGNDA